MILLTLILACSETPVPPQPISTGEQFLSCWPQLSKAPIPNHLKRTDTAGLLFVLHPSSQRLIAYTNNTILVKENELFCFHLQQGQSLTTGMDGWGTISGGQEHIRITLDSHEFSIHSTMSPSIDENHPQIEADNFTQLKELLQEPGDILLLQ